VRYSARRGNPVDVSSPISTIIPSLDGPVLACLAATTAPLGLAQIHRQVGHSSKSGVRQVLLRLKNNGIISEIPGGFVLNRLHITAQAVEILADLHGELNRRIRSAVNTWKSEVLLVGLFGSAARRDGNSSSDIDILIVSDSRDLKELADQLASQVTVWTGNPAQIVAINRKDLKRLRQAKEPIVGHWQTELVVISGDVRILQSSSK